jgi:uncharacterized protein (DUF362 family)
MNSPHPVYSRNATVHIVTGTDKLEALNLALTQSQFLQLLQRRCHESGKTREQFLIAIKPNIMTASLRDENSPVYTDPTLVEALIRTIRDHGFRNIAVVEARNVYDYSYQGRTVHAVASMVGYDEEGYCIHDLSAEKVTFDYGGALGVHTAGRTWRDADYRISFAKNKTHWQCFYTACIKNVYGCLPEWDKMFYYHGSGIEFYEAAVCIADRLPVHFGLLDAWFSADGLTGHVRDLEPNQTKAILASDNVFALDWVAGEKMGLDPTKNFVMQESLYTWGPIRISRRGDMTPWQAWRNVGRLPVVLFAWLEEWYHVSRLLSRATAAHQDERFPPVSRAQWFFGMFQGVVRRAERLLTARAPTEPPALRDPTILSMDPASAGVLESFLADMAKWSGVLVGVALLAGTVWGVPFGLTGLLRISVFGVTAVAAASMIVGGMSGVSGSRWLSVALLLGILAWLTWIGVTITLGLLIAAVVALTLTAGYLGLWSVHRRVSRRRLGRRRRRAATSNLGDLQPERKRRSDGTDTEPRPR